MTSAEEENFPRGCRKTKLPQKRPKKDNNLFSGDIIHKVKKPKRSKKSEKQSVTEQLFHNSLNIQGTLTYNKIQEGMIILGCIRHITNFSLEVELPGLTFGFVHINNISDTFTEHLNSVIEESEVETQDILRDMFKVGQFVVVRIVSVESDEKGKKIKCSLKPSDINYEKSHSSFKKGMLIWGCIQSKLDHGYEINLGIKNCRVFLPSKNVDEGRELSIGEPMWYAVHKSESSNSVTTLRVSAKIQHINDTKIEEINNLHDVIPGMRIEFLTEKITTNGIQGKFINNYFGYIDQTQLRSPLDKLDTYKEGKLIMCFVLYIEPSTKITHFTLRNLDPVPPPPHNSGDILSAEVITKGYNGLYLKLNSKEKCIVTNKRLAQALPKSANINLSEAISSKFPIGSKHTCRILDYSRMSRMYICAVDQGLIKEKLFSSKDVHIGQLLNVTVDSVKSDGLVVVAGHIRGFVPNLHISNSKYSESLKKKFNAGDKFNARVTFIREDNIIFTLKSGLVESDNCLTSLEQVEKGNQYPGVVVETKLAGALVAFYNNILGWLSRQRLDDEDSESKPDPTKYFYIGQVVKPWVVNVKGDKLILTLKPPLNIKKEIQLKIGQRVKGIVGKVHKDRIDIKSSRGIKLGIVPINHLSSSLALCSAILKTFKPGDTIQDLLCVNNKTSPFLLSRREALINNRQKKIKIKHFKSLRPGVLVRCSYVSHCDLGIYVLPLIFDFVDNVLIKNMDIVNNGEPLPKFVKDQSIIAKVLTINHDANEIRLTIKNSLVFDNSVETVVSYFSQYLGDLKYLQNYGSQHGWDICQYQPGERIECTVKQLGDEGGCLVTLPNGAKGLVAPQLCPEKLNPGDSVEGVFLAQDFKESFVEICLRKNISQKINKIQDGHIDTSSVSSYIVENLLKKKDYVLGVLKQNGGNKQLVYIPLYLHDNDRKGCDAIYEQDKFKICICGKANNCLIGMSKKLFLTLDKQKLLVRQKKLIRNSKDSQIIINDGSKVFTNGKDSVSLDRKEDKEDEGEEEEDVGEEIEEEDEEEEIVEEEEDQEDELENEGEEEEDNDEEVEEEQEDDETEEVEEEEGIVSQGTSTSEEELSEDEDFESNSSSSTKSGIKRKRQEANSAKNIKFGEDIVKNFDTSDSITGPLPVLPGVTSFFNSNNHDSDKTSSDEEEEVETIRKKIKLSRAERAELFRKEEERLSKIEKELADPTNTPQTAEHFERLLLANPNSSELWIRYVTFHIAETELDKARSVVKRALETINMTAVEEKFNVWIALLNLENLYGTKESFDKTFEEAIKYVDPLNIYLNAIKMLSETEKFSDMEEKIKKVRNKYKQEPTMWLEVAKIYYSINKFKEARNIKEAALKSLKDRKTQLNLIIRFAIMEFKYGEEQQGAAIFETILSSDPKKVNVWIIYVDQLVKKGRVDQARKVLERSVCQRLPLKCMKTLFLKFRMFEERHGTPDTVEAIKLKAAEYFANAVKN